MRAKEFTKTNSYSDSRNSNSVSEGNDTSPSDVEQNHPEVYKFVKSITGPYSIRDATVESFDLGNTHHVVISIQPSAGLGNTRSVMQGLGIKIGENGYGDATGSFGDVKYEIRDEKHPGNIKEIWTFQMPKAVQESNIEEMTEGPTSNADDIIANYNHENMMAGGSEAHLTGSDTVTVLSLDDFEDMFIGSVAEFEAWANSMSGSTDDAIQANQDWNARPEVSGIQDRGGYETMSMSEDERDFDDGKVKVKFGKSKPFKSPSFDDSMRTFIDKTNTRPRNRDDDDGSRGLSNRDRNR